MSEISVIVPVYKVEKYLSRCIDSILAQTFTDFELILIDDGSPDNCGAICDEYARKDARVSVIHQENLGVSVARNSGLQVAKGKYIAFVDSDDYIAKDYLEILITSIISTNADISICSFTEVAEEASDCVSVSDKACLLAEFQANDKMIELCNSDRITNYLWNKLYKKDLFNEIRFPVNVAFWEDAAIMYRLFDLCEKVVFIDKTLYFYVCRKGSATKHVTIDDVLAQYHLCVERLDFLKDKYPELENFLVCSVCSVAYNAWALQQRESFDSKIIFDAVKFLKANGRRCLKNWNGRKYYNYRIGLYLYARPFLKFLIWVRKITE